MDVQFLEKIPFYTKTSLQGENFNKDQSWQQEEQPKPALFFLEINQEMDTLPRENAENTDLSMPSKILSQTGGETLPPKSTELRVYTRLGFNPSIENLPIYPEHGQSSSPINLGNPYKSYSFICF